MARATIRVNLSSLRWNYHIINSYLTSLDIDTTPIPLHSSSCPSISSASTLNSSLSPSSSSSSSRSILAVIKANAYGHGVQSIAQSLMKEDVPGLAVASLEEGIQLRDEYHITHPYVVLLQGIHINAHLHDLLAYNLIPVIENLHQLRYSLQHWPSDRPIWIKVDTGMHRLGLRPDIVDIYLDQCIQRFTRRNLVLFTHYSCSDDIHDPFNQEQHHILMKLQQKYQLPWSISNSGAIMTIPESCGTWNRAGFMLYGQSPLITTHPLESRLKPVMSFTAPIIGIREISSGQSLHETPLLLQGRSDTYIATVAVGYGDGYPYSARCGTPVLLKNQYRAPLVGRVGMDTISINVTNIPTVKVGDEVCLWGENLTLNEIAAYSGTIGDQLVTQITSRPTREYRS